MRESFPLLFRRNLGLWMKRLGATVCSRKAGVHMSFRKPVPHFSLSHHTPSSPQNATMIS
jgi:hypothetical protein